MIRNTTTNHPDFYHPLYIKHEHQVQLCNDIYNGIDTAKQHLLQHNQENDDDFKYRYETAVLNNFIERIVTTMSGQIFRKPLSFEDMSDKLIETFNDMQLSEFAKEVCVNAIRDGKAYVFVDRSREGGEPYFIHVPRASLINWRKGEDGEFTMAMITELYAEEEEFKLEYKYQLRHIAYNGTHYVYRKEGSEWALYETINTSYGDVPLFELDISDVPALYDIAVINKNHFNAYSDKDNIVSKATRPSFFTKGLGLDDNTDLKLGVNYSINTDNSEAEVSWIEINGDSIPQAQEDLKNKEEMMAVRALQTQEKSQKIKTATQSIQENSESTARLSDIAEDIENTMNKVLNTWHKMKYNTDISGTVVVNKDFRDDAVDSNVLLGLNQLVVAGNLSKETMLKSLIKHEIVDIESVKEELRTIDEEFIPNEVVPNETKPIN